MDDMAINTEYTIRMILKLLDKCKSLEELRKALEEILAGT